MSAARKTNCHEHTMEFQTTLQQNKQNSLFSISTKDPQIQNMERPVKSHLVNTETIALGVPSVPILYQIKCTQRPALPDRLKWNFQKYHVSNYTI
jgi:hypothetical protein